MQMHASTGCVLMASGLSTRFGSNKLLAQFDGLLKINLLGILNPEEYFIQLKKSNGSGQRKESNRC